MSELLIISALAPLSTFVFNETRRARITLMLMSLVVALSCIALSVYFQFQSHGMNLIMWVAPFSIAIIGLRHWASSKGLPFLVSMGYLFLLQASLASSFTNILILLLFSDLLFCSQSLLNSDKGIKKNAIRGIVSSATTYLPAIATVLLGLKGAAAAPFVMATIVLRISSWPFPNWSRNTDPSLKLPDMVTMFVGAYLLWASLGMEGQVIWAIGWFGLATLLSLGATFPSVVVAMALGAVTLNGDYGIVFELTWPFFVVGGFLCNVQALIFAALGYLVTMSITALVGLEPSFGIAVFTSILFARAYSRWEPTTEIGAMDGVVTAVIISVGTLLYMEGFRMELVQGPAAITFATSFLVFGIFGRFFIAGKKLFKPLENLPLPQFLSSWIGSLQLVVEKEGPGDEDLLESRQSQNLFTLIESETAILCSLGVLGAVLIWGLS